MATTTLKILREVKGYKQEEIADVLGISQNTYSRLERDPKSLTAEQAQKLAEFYNVGIGDLLSEAIPVITFHQPKFDNSNIAYLNQVENDYRQPGNMSEINSLKEEIEYLRQQNKELIKALGRK
ncbi:helix-turn-helix transcriptional regulator [Agriterribacter sp.]|uniref:helix-turn-helix domain-containing protein n=1 Tax=Agriterribacter sp. TaxID=2821509 RepID=UPI002C2BBDF2|nr:helix-turn-helix transcriptional regulator [Agriterribacter sp.]HTN08708.1 helix-turn-helix transcriptional regulator [Agriterribacter sp.]